MSSSRVWLYRALVVAGGAFMVVVWFMPWWEMDVAELGRDIVMIRPWGLETAQSLGGFQILMKRATMPDWFAPMMWAYLGLCMLALLVGLFVKRIEFGIGKFKLALSQILIAGVGFSYVVAGIVMAVYATIRTSQFYELPLQGHATIDLGDPLIATTDTTLTTGYYLIYVAGLVLIALGLLRDRIVGKAQ
jgi:hypothetical protein